MSSRWDMPYAGGRAPVMAGDVVATSQPLASAAGLGILREGGNAVDAAVAIAATLAVVEPVSNGIGSDAFAMVHDGEKLHGLNASGRAPAAWDLERFVGRKKMPVRGWESVTVPGAVGAWVALWRRFGRLDFEELLAPAVRYAREGYAVSPVTARAWLGSVVPLGDQADFCRDFMVDGRTPAAGEQFKFESQAKTLEEIAATEGESFYRGELARKIAAHAKANGGAMTEADLAGYGAEWVEPIGVEYGECEVWELPPNGQGAAALMALGVLRHLDVERFEPDGADAIHLQVEAMKVAFAEVHRHVGDVDSMKVGVGELLDADFLRERAGEIDLEVARFPESSIEADHGTVYFATADHRGMMVSMIQSNYMGFGSGVVVPGTGIALQNRGAGFVLERGHANCVGGGKRPFHTIIPGFVTKGGKSEMSFGVMGGHMQPQGHVQMVLRVLGWGQNVQAASDAPRWHVTEDFGLALEAGTDAAVVEELKRRGHRIRMRKPAGLFGGAQLIQKLEGGGYVAGSDHRKDGLAIGF